MKRGTVFGAGAGAVRPILPGANPIVYSATFACRRFILADCPFFFLLVLGQVLFDRLVDVDRSFAEAMPVPEAIFKPTVPGEAVATLVLIENSQAMVHGWSDLRDHHLPTLLSTVRLANPIVPIQVLWLITSPVGDDESSPSHYDKELPDITFDLKASNKISPAIINRGITLLASTFKGQLAARHLLLVTASAPSAGSNTSGVSEWHNIAQKLQEERIFLHVILNPAQNMDPFNGLYYDALNRQNHQEVVPWFTADPLKYQFRLSGTPPKSAPRFEAPSDVSVPTVPVPYIQAPILQDHPPLLRNRSYPPDPVTPPRESTSESQPDVVMPSLVTRLQKMHGLTKKKVYGSQPTRQPFIRDERVPDQYRQVPTPLSIPPLSPSSSSATKSPSTDSRVPSKTKTQRAKRLSGKSPLTTGPPEAGGSSGRRSPWYRRSPRGAMPTDSSSGSYPSSPTSVSSFSVNSPVLPTPRDFDSRAAGAVNSVSAPWEPSWLRDETEQYSSASTLSADSTSVPTYEQGSPSPSYSAYPSQQLSPTSSAARDNFTSTSVSLQTLRTNERVEATVAPSPIDDGDRPFILCPEYEAAATARFNAIFQTSPRSPNFPDLTSMNRYADAGSINSRDSYYTPPNTQPPALSPPAPLVNFSYDQDTRQTPSQQFAQTIPHAFSPMNQDSSEFFASGGSSSLEGWDGRYPV